MKAFALVHADQPATLVELPDPVVSPDGLLIRMRAASVNGFDVYQAGGQLAAMMEHAFPTVVGRDFAGVVEAVGSGRTDWAVGDEVFGFVPPTLPLQDGTYAEVLAGANLVLARKPADMSFEIAAAIPLAGATALDSVDAVAVSPGDTVLVVGATGGVGHIALQLAAALGATVIATARTGDEDGFVRRLGAAETVDYTGDDVATSVRARLPDGVDALIDVVSRGDAFTQLAELVRSGGRVATTLGAADIDALTARNVRATNVMGAPTPDKLSSLAELALAGSLRIDVERTYPLAEVEAALAAFQAGTRGKLVLTI